MEQVNPKTVLTRIRSWTTVVWILPACIAFLAVIWLTDSDDERIQIRNALIASIGSEQDFTWAPPSVPPQFLRESGGIPPEFREAAAAAKAAPGVSSEFATALRLALHLVEGGTDGAGIRGNTLEAYRRIRRDRTGYCSDYTQVMNGLAYASGIEVREWGMSFGGYGADGHSFSEVYDTELSKWVFVDSFYSFYVVDRDSATPLSVLELRERLASGRPDTVQVVRISPEQFGFKSDTAALKYYSQGIERLFLYFGNSTFSYDSHPLIVISGKLSRSVEELIAIALGLRPRMRLYPTETNLRDAPRLVGALRRLIGLVLTIGICLLVGLTELVIRRNRSGRDSVLVTG